ncbi:MAG: Gfo/Idh/MocA family oxidoreductase [Saprospiraceae bacterium]|nr:Gfo/Idh/MocA family oxidoreductase [Saprospiraceae bacterium]
MAKSVNWGILGCGKIAHKFAQDLMKVPDTQLVAVASRSKEKAKDFGRQYGVSNCYGSYEALVNDPTVNACYIATVHPFHKEITMLCLNHRKAVLCEKPMGMDQEEVKAMIQRAKEKDVFLMEGIWTRFIPAVGKMLGLIQSETLGDVRSVHADFGFLGDQDRSNRLFNKSLGGGALLDIGIYPLYLSLLVLGYPEDVEAAAQMTETGVDESCGMILRHRNGAVSSLHCTFMTDTQIEGWIHGSKGSIKLHSRFHHPNKVSIYRGGEIEQTYNIPYIGNGYYHEILHVNECIRLGLKESPKVMLNDSLNLVKMLDEVREKIGLVYE